MKFRQGGQWLSDGRSSRGRGRVYVIAALVTIALVAYILAASSDGDEETPEEDRVAGLDTPDWNDGELNRPSLPGQNNTNTELEVTQNNDDPLHVLGKVQRNQTLFVALRNRGLMPDRIQPVVDAMSAVFDFRRSRPGDTYEARLDLDGNILEFKYQTSPEDIYVARLMGDRYIAEKVVVPKEVALVKLEGTVSGSLFQSFGSLGESSEVAQDFIDIFSFDFDFGSSSQQGDRFRLLVEKIYLDGEFYKYGRILAAEYQTTENVFNAYYFDKDPTDEEDGKYYDAEAVALERMFIKSPVRNAKMTSKYGPRFHPILKRDRMHHGIDWAAPTGTPIMAIADGTIDFIGWKGGNGNLVVLSHDDGYTSLYAHLHGFRRGLKKGDKVKQRDVIAYLGNTGLSTAPHLHFGMKKHGKYFDPLTLDLSKGPRLTGAALKAFQSEQARLQAFMDGSRPLGGRRPMEPPTPPKSDGDDSEKGGKKDGRERGNQD